MRPGLHRSARALALQSPARLLALSADGVDGVVHTYAELRAPGPYPPGLFHVSHREAYLAASEFQVGGTLAAGTGIIKASLDA